MTPSHRFVLALATLALLLPGCKSADRVMFQPSPAALVERLPSLEITVDNGPLNTSAGALPEDPQRLFEREVRMNLSDPEDTLRFGTAQLQVVDCRTKRTGKVLQGLQMATFMLPSLLGVPLEWYETDLKAAVQIVSAKGDTLATYTGRGQSRVRVAVYHGYSQTQAHRVADLAALREALAQIKLQLDNDSGRLRGALLAAGPIKRGEGLSTGSLTAPADEQARTAAR
ncbi:hypothetical protein GCM10028821_41810 [Hymenobacter jeollabukensis]